MTASFSKNINLLNLFVYYPLDCHAVSPFLQHVRSLLQFLILEIITVLRKIKKKSGGNKNKFGTTNSKNHENFKNIKPRVQFYWLLYEKSVTPVNGCFLKLFTGFIQNCLAKYQGKWYRAFAQLYIKKKMLQMRSYRYFPKYS